MTASRPSEPHVAASERSPAGVRRRLARFFADTEVPPQGFPPLRGYAAALGQVALATLLAHLLFDHVHRSDLVLIYTIGVVAVAVRHGTGPTAAAAVLSVVVVDYLYFPPYFESRVSEPRELMTLGVMLAVGLLISRLTSRIRRQAEAARLRELRTATLYSLSRELAQLRRSEEIAGGAARHVAQALGARVVILLRDGAGELLPIPTTDVLVVAAPHELAVARWAGEHGPAGAGTDTEAGAAGTYLPLTLGDVTVGVIGLVPAEPATLRDPVNRQMLETLCGQTAQALHRVQLAHEAQSAELRARTEELRSSLLSSVSHDLRTPLAAVTGAASTLLVRGDLLSSRDRADLAQAIHEEAARLGRLVANLLDMTRLESGALVLKKEWIPLEEPLGAALGQLETQLATRKLEVEIPADLPLVPMDASLVEQLLINLVENALKYAKSGPIEVCGRTTPEGVEITVADRGPGVPAGSEGRLFEKFYRATPGGGARGAGLGLAICRAIVTAHDGHISVANRDGGGTMFTVRLPITGTPPAVPIDAAPSGQDAIA
jgi:two-component system sensor histidine kinase KdpD